MDEAEIRAGVGSAAVSKGDISFEASIDAEVNFIIS